MQVFGVASRTIIEDTEETLTAFRAQTGVTFPFLIEPSATTYHQYANAADDLTTPYPLDVLIDGNGIVRYLRGEFDADALWAAVDTWCP